jgi:fructose-1,6-bisphosphatase/inositol monophosphatase family enzyme
MAYDSYLEFVRQQADDIRATVLSLWDGADLEVTLKADKSPVTKVDRMIESLFRKRVEEQFPSHAVFGEEFGLTGPNSDFVWVIDPIDGTQSLVNRVPTFGTFLALVHRGEPVVGLIDIPVLGLGVSGAVGSGARDGYGRRIDLTDPRPLCSNDIVALGTARSFAKGGDTAFHHRALETFPTARAYYDCFGHYLAATEGIAGLVEMNVPCWDVIATDAIVRAAAGMVHHVRGNAPITELRSSILGRPAAVEAIRAIL